MPARQRRQMVMNISMIGLLAACDTGHGPVALQSGVAIANVSPSFSDWSVPINLGTAVNSAFPDNLPELSANGLSLYFTSGRPGGSGGLDLWVSQRASVKDPWGTPVNLGASVNSIGNDAAPNLSRDGHYLFITSNRAGGSGDNDIWVLWRSDVHDDFAWQSPVNLGSPINGATFDAGAAFRRPEFYFTSGPNSSALDIYLAPLLGNEFGQPEVVAELSSSANDQRPSIRYDRREIFFSSTRAGGSGGDDLWSSERVAAAGPWSTPVNLGTLVNTPFVDTQASLSEDGTTLFFTSNRPGGSGGLDLWVTTRVRSPEN